VNATPSGTDGGADGYDLLIAGAGPVGCVIAERAASVMGWRSLIVEKRPHIAGNCYDREHASGVLVHQYGPHYFRTNSAALIEYLSRFTAWIPGNYIVRSSLGGVLYPFPINLTTLELFFGRTLDETSARALLDALRSPIDAPANSEEFVLSRVGRAMYEAFYEGYTVKQWARHPRDLDASVCGRIPIRFTRDDRYVDHAYQVTPARGFTALFERMTADPRITVRLNTDFRDVRGAVTPRRATIYTGPLDEYYDHCYGPLAWRSLDFEWRTFDQPFVQPCVQINFPDVQVPYTRSVEIKHVTGQEHPQTVVSYEYPRADGEPFYPVPDPVNRQIYRQYEERARADTAAHRVYFAGRLARYVYINTDEAIESALALFDVLQRECA